jgi:hypothetical protein
VPSALPAGPIGLSVNFDSGPLAGRLQAATTLEVTSTAP